jgi:uncharacterized protein (TIGR03118 family)
MRHSTRNFRPALERLEERAMLSASYIQTDLVSNIQGVGLKTDPSLVNPWDVNFPQKPGINPPVLVADQGTGMATAYQISSDGSTVIDRKALAVTIPTVGSSEPSGPTGVVQNTHADEFLIPGPGPKRLPIVFTATYIFDTLQGTIEAISSANPTSAEIMVNNSSTAEYTGLAAGTFDNQDYIYAANEGTKPGIQVFNSSFQLVTTFGTKKDPVNNPFIDPCLPAGLMPYNVRDISLGNSHKDADLFVTYRSPNFQGGAVAVFTNDGTFLGQIADDTTEGNLQSPWGLAFIKHGFGEFSGDLLVGNFSSGQIDAYTVNLTDTEASGAFVGLVRNPNGTPLTITGLRSIHFGPGLADSAHPDHTHVALLFTAETDLPAGGNFSLYGEITPAKVNLVTSMATGASGISSIEQVNGGGQGDMLAGNGSGIMPVETAVKNFNIEGTDAMLDSGYGQDIVFAGSTIYGNSGVALQAIESYWSTNGNNAGDTIDLGQDAVERLVVAERIGLSADDLFSGMSE